jgi:hypothetical protein
VVGFDDVRSYVQFFYEVSVIGTFARNLYPGALQFAINTTGSHMALDFRNNWDQGPNVSSDRQQVVGFWSNDTGTLTATLTNGGGPGPSYEFEYGAHGQTELLSYRDIQFVGFRATVTGWMLPPIRVAVIMEITNVPKTIGLFAKGTSWTVYGFNETSFELETIAPFTVTGAFDASYPVTAYVLNLTEHWEWSDSGSGVPPVWHWKSAVGTQAVPIDALLPTGGWWSLVFVATSAPGPGLVTVVATQDIVATT